MLKLNVTPFPEIQTERLILRKLKSTDASQLLFLRSDEKVMQFIGREKTKSLDEAAAFIEKINKSVDNNESVFWAVALKSTPDTMIGTICYWNILNDHYRAEVGYMLHPHYWSQGLMKETLIAIIKYGFEELKLHSIEARINPDNIVSGLVLEKTGFKREAYYKEDFCFRGKFFDTAVYSLVTG